ncbi:MAG TPA: DapH/DapD/GlmU-related protein [Opitutaceae bacterium]|nr:DapH/DapD/GlmU-related protein [Opitutaceae bacterium]
MAGFRQQLKSLVRAISNRSRFPRARIGKASYISDGCTISPGVVIGSKCHVFQSDLGSATVLGDESIVGHNSRVAHSVVGRNCLLETHTEIFNSTLADFVSVHPKCSLNHTQVGRHSYIARETFLNDVSIGGFTSVGPQTLLGCGDHPAHFISTAPVFYSTRRQCGTSFATQDHFPERKPIKLGNDVWLGAHVFVRDGLTIGDGAIVAAGSVVIKDVPPYAIVGGVPAKLIRMRFSEDHVSRLLTLQWWNWDEARLRAAQPWFAQDDINAFLAHVKS